MDVAQLNMDTGSKHDLYCLHIFFFCGVTVDLLTDVQLALDQVVL